jgi:hypothetical protein
MRLAEIEFITLPALTADAKVESAMFVSASVVLVIGVEGRVCIEAK